LVLLKFDGKKGGKGLREWSSGSKGKGSKCKAIMKGNGSFSILNGSRKEVWSSHTDGQHDGPYEIILHNNGNFILFNRHHRCTWAIQGCPKGTGAKLKFNAKAKSNLKKRNAAFRKRLKSPQLIPHNIVKSKKVANKKPKLVKPSKAQRSKPIKKKVSHSLKERIRRLIEGKKGLQWRKLKKLLKRKYKLKFGQRKWHKLKKAARRGASHFFTVFDKMTKQAVKSMIRKNKNTKKTTKKKSKKAKVSLKKGLNNSVWVQKIKKIYHKHKTNRRFRQIRKILRSQNFNGKGSYWSKIRKSYNRGNYKKFIKQFQKSPVPKIKSVVKKKTKTTKPQTKPQAKPALKTAKPTYTPKKLPAARKAQPQKEGGKYVSKYHWVPRYFWQGGYQWALRQNYYMTYYWTYYWRWFWYRQCWWIFCWWRTGWTTQWYPVWYWSYYNYWSYEYRWNYVGQWRYEQYWAFEQDSN